MSREAYTSEFYVHDDRECQKIPYPSKSEAKRQIRLAADKIPDRDARKRTKKSRVYQCPKCGQWHTTLQKTNPGRKDMQRRLRGVNLSSSDE